MDVAQGQGREWTGRGSGRGGGLGAAVATCQEKDEYSPHSHHEQVNQVPPVPEVGARPRPPHGSDLAAGKRAWAELGRGLEHDQRQGTALEGAEATGKGATARSPWVWRGVLQGRRQAHPKHAPPAAATMQSHD